MNGMAILPVKRSASFYSLSIVSISWKDIAYRFWRYPKCPDHDLQFVLPGHNIFYVQ